MNIEQLIKLSEIFKQGFTVECKNGKLNQYTNYDKPFIVSYKTIIKIKDTPEFKNTNKVIIYKETNIPDNCVIGGWFDSDTNTYYIEINKVFSSVYKAESYAIEHNQKAFYNIRTGKTIFTRE